MVGGKHYQSLEHSDLVRAYELIQHSPDTEQEINITGAIFVRSVFFGKHGYKGTLYRVNECCLVESVSGEVIIKIAQIFSFKIMDKYFIFLKGLQYTPCDIHSYSDNPIVEATTSNTTIQTNQVKRKVMLYPHEDNKFIVIDYQRPQIPLNLQDVPVPQYPEVGDLVTVNGDSGDIWLARIHSVNLSAKTCQVYFYIADKDAINLYRREHHRLNTLHWDSILELKTRVTWSTDDTFTLSE